MGLFFEEGGFGMYPTLIFGFMLMASAVLSIRHPERKWLTFVMAALTTAAGVLGTSMGLINTMKAAAKQAPDQQFIIFSVGTAESLNNMVLAMILVVLALLVSAVAAFLHAKSAAKA